MTLTFAPSAGVVDVDVDVDGDGDGKSDGGVDAAALANVVTAVNGVSSLI